MRVLATVKADATGADLMGAAWAHPEVEALRAATGKGLPLMRELDVELSLGPVPRMVVRPR